MKISVFPNMKNDRVPPLTKDIVSILEELGAEQGAIQFRKL